MTENDESSLISSKLPCDKCGSSDGFAIYSNGWGHCFVCNHHPRITSDDNLNRRRPSKLANCIEGTPFALKARKLSMDTSRRFKYHKGSYKGESVQVANYTDSEGNLVAQKIRNKDKIFTWLGDKQKTTLFGSHLWPRSGKILVVTEGEIDCMSLSQIQDHKWPVVSIANGAAKEEGLQKVKKEIEKHIEFFLGFEKVIFMFDSDDQGRLSANAAASVLPPGKGFTASLPLKDVNEMLVKGRSDEVIKAIWSAKEYKPDWVVNMAQLREEIKKEIQYGDDWPWPDLTRLTYGIRDGEIHTIGAGPGVGKTDFLFETLAHTVIQRRKKVAAILLETPIDEAGKRLAGKVADRTFHIPDVKYNEKEMDNALDALGNNVFLTDTFGSTEWSDLKNLIHYYVQGLGIKDIWLDHLTAISIKGSNDLDTLKTVMEDLGKMVKGLKFTLFLVSHLARPNNTRKPYSQGGEVRMEDFYGSSAIEKWSHYMWGLERDLTAEEDVDKSRAKLRCLKDRYTGRASGKYLFFQYNQQTGRLLPAEAENPFANEPTEETEY